MKILELTNNELFYLEDFMSKEWFEFVDTIVDKSNMNNLDKEIYDMLLKLLEKIRSVRKGK